MLDTGKMSHAFTKGNKTMMKLGIEFCISIQVKWIELLLLFYNAVSVEFAIMIVTYESVKVS